MIAQELLRRQLEMAPKDDLTPFDGEWVVLRAGHVVAHARVACDLTLSDGDAILRVSMTPQLIV